MLENLKEQVYYANMLLAKYDLVKLTWGNVSGIDRDSGYVVIKPSGVEYEKLTPYDMVVVNLEGHVIEGSLRPSSDTQTHLQLYKHFEDIKGIVHTHSRWCTIFSQAGKSIPALGTTHADYFPGDIPCTRSMTDSEIKGEYEVETAKVILETFDSLDYNNYPGVLVKNHGPFSWGRDPIKAVENALVMEEIAMLAYHTMILEKDIESLNVTLLNKHFYRKHGANAYYGQR